MDKKSVLGEIRRRIDAKLSDMHKFDEAGRYENALRLRAQMEELENLFITLEYHF
jgi:hypothetical protein